MKPIGEIGNSAYLDSFGPRLPSTRLRAAITKSPATADAVGKNLGAPVESRIPALSGQPPGVIVLVTG